MFNQRRCVLSLSLALLCWSQSTTSAAMPAAAEVGALARNGDHVTAGARIAAFPKFDFLATNYDRSYGGTSFGFPAFTTKVVGYVAAVLPLKSGGVLVVTTETAETFNAPQLGHVYRLDGDGNVDRTFGVSGHIELPGVAVGAAIGDDGVAVLAVHVAPKFVSQTTELQIFRIVNTATTLAAPVFQDSGLSLSSFGGIDRFGRIYVSNNTTREVKRLLTTGAPDATWGTLGVRSLSDSRHFLSVRVSRSGGVYAQFANDVGFLDTRIYKLTETGADDTTFGGGGSILLPDARLIGEDVSGNLLVRQAIGGAPNLTSYLERYTANGARFPFQAGSPDISDLQITNVIPDQRGMYLLGYAQVIAINNDGSLRSTFSPRSRPAGVARLDLGPGCCQGIASFIGAAGALDASGRVVLAGPVSMAGEVSFRTARLLSAGVNDDVVSVVPVRLLDTRPASLVGYSGGKPGAGSTVAVDLVGTRGSGVPSTAASVVVNVTGTEATSDGFVTVWPCGQPRPTASTLNLTTGATAPNLAVVGVGADGTICIFTQSGAHLIVDLVAYAPNHSSLLPRQPGRALDTRTEPPATAGQLGWAFDVTAGSAGSVPPTADAAIVNLTATDVRQAGYVSTDCRYLPPRTSAVNVTPGQTRANAAVIPVVRTGRGCVKLSAPMQLVVDVIGYVDWGSSIQLPDPFRLLDTRPGSAAGYSGAKPGAGAVVEVDVTAGGQSPAPADLATAIINVTATEASAAGYVTAWPCGSPRPVASNLNVVAGDTVANLVIVKAGPNARVCLFTQSGTHLIADLVGYL